MTSWVVAAALAMAACGSKVGTPSGERVPLGREFTLGVGQTAVVGDTGLRLFLQGVSEDSRCPVDVTCVWEGDAKVSIDVAAPAPRAAYDLHTSGRFDREVKHGAYRITLVALDPAPRSTVPPSSRDYRATLVVVR